MYIFSGPILHFQIIMLVPGTGVLIHALIHSMNGEDEGGREWQKMSYG
jgi:hypothetical protein